MKTLLILLTFFSINAYAKPVNVNTANAKTISQSLKGVGQKKAAALIQYRKKNGPFKSLKDLTQVKGIGIKIVQNNSGDILFSNSKK